MINLLNETKEAIKRSGHTIKNIIFIGSEGSGHSCTWEEFRDLANVEYDSGYGGQKVASDLIFVFEDGQKMWRGEYDGSEWWEFGSPFVMPENKLPIKSLFADIGWDSLQDINSSEYNQ
jgi:hypothetical protein